VPVTAPTPPPLPALSALPPGYVVDNSGVVYDLTSGTPVPVGHLQNLMAPRAPPPSVPPPSMPAGVGYYAPQSGHEQYSLQQQQQALREQQMQQNQMQMQRLQQQQQQQQQQSQAQASQSQSAQHMQRADSRDMPPHQSPPTSRHSPEGRFEQAAKGPVAALRPSHGRTHSSIPASAARVAAFQPGSSRTSSPAPMHEQQQYNGAPGGGSAYPAYYGQYAMQQPQHAPSGPGSDYGMMAYPYGTPEPYEYDDPMGGAAYMHGPPSGTTHYYQQQQPQQPPPSGQQQAHAPLPGHPQHHPSSFAPAQPQGYYEFDHTQRYY
jgi:hypothetical protein